MLTAKTSAPLLRERPLLTLYLVDTWAPPPPGSSYAEQRADTNAQKSRAEHEAAYQLTRARVAFAADRAVLLRMDSAAAAARIDDGALDFAFLDGDHSREGVIRDVQAWLPKVRRGGWIGGHDYGHPLFPGVAEAVAATLAGHPELDHDRTWFWRVDP